MGKERNSTQRPLPLRGVRTGVVLGLEAALTAAACVAAACLPAAWSTVLVPAAVLMMGATAWYLRRTMARVRHDYLELDRAVKTYQLVKLLEGEPLSEDELNQVFLEKLPDYYTVVLLGAVDEAAVMPDPEVPERPLFYREDQYLRSVFKPALDRCGASYFIPRADGLAIVVCLPELDEDGLDRAARDTVAELCRLTEAGIARVREESGLILGAVVSTVFQGQEQLAAAYREAAELTSYAELMGDKATVKNAYDHLDAPMELSQRKRRMDLEKQYLGYVASRDYRKAGQTLDALIEAELPMAVRYPEMLKNRLVMRLEQLLNSLCISMDDYDSAAYPVVERFRALVAAATVEELRQRTAAVAEAVAAYADHAATSNSGKVAEALAFIRDNYADPNMGAALLSEKLGLSSSYLSRIIKQATGAGIVDCIHTERIKAAKELLTQTDLSVDDIAEKVGFSNRWTFTRSFKRYEGTTPGAYREAQRELP